MFVNVSARKTAAAAKAAAAILLCALPLVFAEECREGAKRGLELCLRVLLPSLFPVMAATGLMVKSGACALTGRLLRRPSKWLFGVSGTMAPVILMSLIGGYPVGAAGISALRRQGAVSEQEAKRAALFAVGAGPGFVTGFVGAAIYGNAAVGRIMLAAQSASVLLLSVPARLLVPAGRESRQADGRLPPSLPFDRALVEAVTEAARNMGVICAFVTVFSAMLALTEKLTANETAQDAVFLLSEVCTAATRLAPKAPVALVAFAVGFGGICVHCQILSALGEVKVNRLLFFLFRILQGALTALLTYIALRLTPQTSPVFSTVSPNTAVYGGSTLSGAVLAGVVICFFISVRQSTRQH